MARTPVFPEATPLGVPFAEADVSGNNASLSPGSTFAGIDEPRRTDPRTRAAKVDPRSAMKFGSGLRSLWCSERQVERIFEQKPLQVYGGEGVR
jgi:hypothetical protein